MTSSMTAFAQGSAEREWGELRCEIRSVNHRYLEAQFRLPETLRHLEPALREQLRGSAGRGKIEVSLRFAPSSDEENLEIDLEQAGRIIRAAQRIGALAGEESALNPLEILRWPGVQKEAETDFDAVADTALDLFGQVLDDFLGFRLREGAALQALVLERVDQIREACRETRGVVPDIVENLRARILERLDEVDATLDESRLEGELVLMAQKMDVEEELDRLETHLDEVTQTLEDADGPCGRRLDFLMQELNREANTLASKSQGSESTRHAIDMKVLIEQMREQIQNIE